MAHTRLRGIRECFSRDLDNQIFLLMVLRCESFNKILVGRFSESSFWLNLRFSSYRSSIQYLLIHWEYLRSSCFCDFSLSFVYYLRVFRDFMVLLRVLSSCLIFSVLSVLFKKNEPECRLAFLNLIIHYCECFKRLQRIRYTWTRGYFGLKKVGRKV